LNRMTDARTEMERERKLAIDTSTLARQVELQTYFVLGEPNEVQKIMTLVAGQPDEFLATEALAGTQIFSGEFQKAAVTTQQTFEQAGLAKAPDVQANSLLTKAAGRGYAGLCDGNEELVQRALGLDRSKQTEAYAVLAAGICGNSKLAMPMAQDLSKRFPQDTLIQRVYVPLAKAFLALPGGQPQEAIDDAQPAKPFALIYPASYVQGLAYLQLHDANHAVSAFRNATLSPGGSLTALTAPFYAQAQLGLARAYVMGGDKEDAKKAYQAFFTTWKDADLDLPMLQAARKEYAAL